MTSREMFEKFFAGQFSLDLRMIGVAYTSNRTELAWEAWRQSSHFYHHDGER
jgi:hypothetical protein